MTKTHASPSGDNGYTMSSFKRSFEAGDSELPQKQCFPNGSGHEDSPAFQVRIRMEMPSEDELQRMNFLQRVNLVANKFTINRSQTFMTFCLACSMFWYAVLTKLYILVYFYLPWITSTFQLNERQMFWVHVGFGGLLLQSVSNWLCTICYTSTASGRHPFIRPPAHIRAIMEEQEEDRPWLKKTLWMDYDEAVKRCQRKRVLVSDTLKDKGVRSGSSYMLDYEPDDENGLQWKYCVACKRDVPPRAHHCPICAECILKRDHHCYMSGVCIGYYNQRYFIVASFYISITIAISLFLNYHQLMETFLTREHFSWWDLFLPLSILKWLFMGSSSGILDVHLVMLSHWYLCLPVGLMGMGFFCMHFSSVVLGLTVHEFRKNEAIRVDQTVSQRMSDVFGRFWMLAFIFPSQIIFPQTGDGSNWQGVYHLKHMKKGVLKP